MRGQEGMMTAEHKMLSRLGCSPSENNALTASYNVILSSISFSSRMLDPSHAEVAAEPCWQALGPGKTLLVYNQITKGEEHEEHVLDINIGGTGTQTPWRAEQLILG